ncbi:MAG: beta-ketoacyl-ACP synthase II [Lentisphaeria bacterium]|nr:beta-ketoacyl-ACP synthase II [Lentisphaeria bacterium]
MSNELSNRVVITGLGTINSVGNNVNESWQNLLDGKSGIDLITKFDASEYRTKLAGEVKNFSVKDHMDMKEAKRLDPFCHYAIAAAAEAIDMAGIEGKYDPERTGVFVSSGIGGILTLEAQNDKLRKSGPNKVSPFLIPMMISDMSSGAISIRYNCKGPNFSIVSACASGGHSIGEAMWAIKRGDADVMIAGGTEACISPIGMAGFCAMKAMSPSTDLGSKASRPFDKNRDGFICAEGAGILVIESLEHAQARGANILAELVGYGATGDAYHITSPAPDANGATRAIKMAMNHGGLDANDISYINAHGTSTPMNDKFETMAIKNVLGEQAYNVPVSSTKSLTGHALGAAGGIEAVISVKAIQDQKIPGTWNYEEPDENCDLDYVPNQYRDVAVDTVLSLNFGFGGHNSVVAFKKFTA